MRRTLSFEIVYELTDAHESPRHDISHFWPVHGSQPDLDRRIKRCGTRNEAIGGTCCVAFSKVGDKRMASHFVVLSDKDVANQPFLCLRPRKTERELRDQLLTGLQSLRTEKRRDYRWEFWLDMFNALRSIW